jgi:hypothetical protein
MNSPEVVAIATTGRNPLHGMGAGGGADVVVAGSSSLPRADC